MSIFVGIGASSLRPEESAIDEAWNRAKTTLQGQIPHFILLFASPTAYNQKNLLECLYKKSPQALVVGCSTSGEISSLGSFDNSLALLVISSASMRFAGAVSGEVGGNERKAGLELAKKLLETGGEKPKTALILPDGLAGNGAEIVRGVLDGLGADFRLAGGSAGDDFEFKQTYQYFGREVYSGQVVGVALYGDFYFGIGVRHGWVPIGLPRIATKSSGNILYELDGKPAISMYQDQFGEKMIVGKDEPLARMAITYPLGIMAPNKDGYLIRDPITVDDRGAITCAAEIPQGSEVYLMIGSKEAAIEAAQDAAKNALKQVEGRTVKAAILFNCIARKKLFLNQKQLEIDKIREIIGHNTPLIGFYTYGEQAPLGSEVVSCSFHNETDVIFLLAE